MIRLYNSGAYLVDGTKLVEDGPQAAAQLEACGKRADRETARKNTIAYSILQQHNTSGDDRMLRLRYDSLTSHDITYVGIIQTARASGMKEFPMPYVLTNCHNSLCAVGGTINEDDHMFALSAAQKYGGIYVPTNLAVIHSYNREMMSRCGNMILGSDSHTRYGALGTMAVGEGGGELAKQLVGRTYDLATPDIIGIYLTGAPKKGVGPHDVALALIGATYNNEYVKNKVMEFVGPGIANLPIQFRNGIDVMTTETTCWSSIWCTDEEVKGYYEVHGRPDDYCELKPGDVAYYDGMIEIDLSGIEPMIALPFHPSNVYTIAQLKENAADIFDKVEKDCLAQLGRKNLAMNLQSKIRGGEIYVDQAIVAGCAGGTFDNICDVADILRGHSVGNGQFNMNVYPDSQPNFLELVRNGSIATLMEAGVVVRSAFCGPCFGAGDTPANGELSIRHTTRNFPNREGSKPGEGQIASVALMDAHSVAATAVNGGRLTAATELDVEYRHPKYYFDQSVYRNRVYNGVGNAQPEQELHFGPNIKDWPQIPELTDDLLLKVVSYITDPVTTTDELIPSGETSSFRSNPLRLAEFALSRKDPDYVPQAKAVQELERAREDGAMDGAEAQLGEIYAKIREISGYAQFDPAATGIGSTIYAVKPGDGSAREQAASCQRVLGGVANIAQEYATKRYRSNLINWGMLPLLGDKLRLKVGDYIYIENIAQLIEEGAQKIPARLISHGAVKEIELRMDALTPDEKKIILSGCLINFNAGRK